MSQATEAIKSINDYTNQLSSNLRAEAASLRNSLPSITGTMSEQRVRGIQRNLTRLAERLEAHGNALRAVARDPGQPVPDSLEVPPPPAEEKPAEVPKAPEAEEAPANP